VSDIIGVPKGIRTPVAAVKGRCPRPLDDGDKAVATQHLKRPGTEINRPTAPRRPASQSLPLFGPARVVWDLQARWPAAPTIAAPVGQPGTACDERRADDQGELMPTSIGNSASERISRSGLPGSRSGR
jgi:hypothetical protein